jgi:membrane-bound lytic murein transglycosylase D
VPGIIAAIIMAKNPVQYGLDKVVPESPVLYDTVQVDYPIDLHLVSDLTDASLPEIVALNPSLLRMTTPRDTTVDLRIPAGTKEAYLTRVKEIPEDKRDSWRFHVVRQGESLDAIATQMHARASEIAQVNSIASDDPVEAGDELVIPVATPASITHPQHYRVQHGDTLITVADRFGVSAEDLRRWNHLSGKTVRPGSTLVVAQPVKLAPSMRARSRTSHGTGTHSSGTKTGAKTASTHTSHSSATKSTSTSTKSKSSASKKKSQAAR